MYGGNIVKVVILKNTGNTDGSRAIVTYAEAEMAAKANRRYEEFFNERNRTLFRVGQYSAYEAAHGGRVQPIARPRIADALRCHGPFLTSLTINGALVAFGHECLRLVLHSSPKLSQVRLYNVNMQPLRDDLPLPHGNHFGGIRELAFIRCEHVQQPLLTFIAQLPHLERLTLHNTTMPSASLRMPCKQLRYLSVLDEQSHVQLLRDAIGGSAETLRELNVLIPNAAYQDAWFEGIQPFLSKQLETLLVRQPVADNRNGELRLDELVGALDGGALRKLVMCDWSAEQVLFDYLVRLRGCQLPQLDTLCLSHSSQSQSMSIRGGDALVDAFGQQLRVLEVRNAGSYMMYELQAVCGRLHELRELHLFECDFSLVLSVVLEAIAASPHLFRVELHITFIEDMVLFVKRVVKGLRRRRLAAAAAALAGGDAAILTPPVLQLRVAMVEFDGIPVPTAEQLRDSNDVLDCQLFADERGFDKRDDDRSDHDDLLHNEPEEYDWDVSFNSEDDISDDYDYGDTDSDDDNADNE